MIEEMVIHIKVVRFSICIFNWKVLIEVKSDNVFET